MLGKVLRGGYTLRAAVMGFVVFPVLLVAGLLGWSVLAKLENEIAARMKEDLELIARSLREPVERALEKEREGAVSEAVKSALGFSRVYGAYVYDAEGQRIASSGPREGRLDEGQISELAESGTEQGRFDEQGEERLYSYFVPLVDSGGRITGLLQLTRRGSDFDAYIEQTRWQGAAALLTIALIMATVVFTGHHRAVGRHFQHYRTVLERVGAGERKLRLTEGGPREIRELTAAFNRMLDQIHASERALAEQREKEQALEARLRQSEKMAAIGQLAAGLAHELGSPLSVVRGKAQRALRHTTDEEQARTLHSINEQVARMERIVSQLMDFGRGRHNEKRPEPLERAVRAAVHNAEEEATGRGIVLETDGPYPGPVLAMDRLRLEQAVDNLLRNALQAARSRVRAHWEADEKEARIRVEDDGPGLDPEQAARLFEPFYTTKPVGEGTGLGLAVVHGAAREHGGRVDADTSPDLGGARFTLTLPLEGASEEELP
ncbi:MAG: ATP-binding protein [Thiohalospira sp.]